MSTPAKGKVAASTPSKDNKAKETKLPAVNAPKAVTASAPKDQKGGKGAATTPAKGQTGSKVEKLPEIKTSPRPEAAPQAPADEDKPAEPDPQAAPVSVGSTSTVPAEQAIAITTEPVPSEPAAPAPVPVEPPKEHNGKVVLIYEQYNEEFPITKGSTTAENIDEVYCLTFVMPGCLIHLSKLNPQEKRAKEAEGVDLDSLYITENPRGTYHGLEDDQTYYVYVEQEAEQLKRDQERMKRIAAGMDGAIKKDAKGNILPKDDGRVLESCSCIYGNPCVDEYGCKDWSNRFAVATKNGWKGF